MDTSTRLRGLLKGSAVIAVAMGVMNIGTYGFVMISARLLGPAEFGSLAAVMGLLLVVNVLSLGLQATGARRISAAPDDLRIEAEVISTSYAAALALGALVLAASPIVTAVLNLASWGSAALVAVTCVPLSIMGGQAGILQGERRWGPLAAIYLAVGLGRIGFGLVGLVVLPNTLGAMTGVAVGAVLPMIVGWLALRRPERRLSRSAAANLRPPARWAPGGVFRETLHNSHALLAFFALSNADVIIARSTLSQHQAGLYAGGLILSKAVLFLPQFVVVIAFPSMAEEAAGKERHLLGLGAVLAIGLVTVAGVAVLSGLAVVFVGGPEYAGLQDQLWVFAALGTLLAMLQLMIYNILARQRQRAVLLVWAALVVLLAVAPFVGSLTTLLAVVVAVDAVLFLLLLVRSLTPSYDAHTRVPAGSR